MQLPLQLKRLVFGSPSIEAIRPFAGSLAGQDPKLRFVAVVVPHPSPREAAFISRSLEWGQVLSVALRDGQSRTVIPTTNNDGARLIDLSGRDDQEREHSRNLSVEANVRNGSKLNGGLG